VIWACPEEQFITDYDWYFDSTIEYRRFLWAAKFGDIIDLVGVYATVGEARKAAALLDSDEFQYAGRAFTVPATWVQVSSNA